MEILAVTLLLFSALFWFAVFRYYHSVSLELSQYAQPPIKSPSVRAAIVSLSGFGSTAVFVFSCVLQNTYLSDYIRGNEFSLPSLIIILLSVCSPLFNYLSVWTFSTFSGGSSLMLANISTLLGCTFVFLVPFGYILYKSRKEIELRFQMAVQPPPKKLYGSFKRRRFIHGNPVVCGILGLLHGVILFPLYLYYDLLRARQGIVEYKKVSHHPQATFEQKITFDAGQQLSSVDEAVIGSSEIPLCPRCKKQMVFLTDQQKWWCEKCKRAAYVT